MFPDASDVQLGARTSQVQGTDTDVATIDEVLKQYHCPGLLHSRKLNDYKTSCTATEKESLSTLGTLVEHRSISCGAKFFVCSDHKNLTRLNTTRASDRVQRHRLLLEEFECVVIHMPGEKNELADALLRLPMKELNDAQEINEVCRLRKVHSDRTKLPITLLIIK